jgi:hypothetical protein
MVHFRMFFIRRTRILAYSHTSIHQLLEKVNGKLSYLREENGRGLGPINISSGHDAIDDNQFGIIINTVKNAVIPASAIMTDAELRKNIIDIDEENQSIDIFRKFVNI